jgi:hypothetical protein
MNIQLIINLSLYQDGYTVVLPITDFIGTIVWGDTNSDTYSSETTSPSHTYATSDMYTISLNNVTKLTKFGNYNLPVIKSVLTQFSYLTKINSLTNFENAFYGYENLTTVLFNENVTDNVTTMFQMFSECSNLNCPITLNCSSCTTLQGLLSFADIFNSSITLTNTNNVTDMSQMFYYAYSFNQPITLDCSSCTSLFILLGNAYNFNSAITLTNTNNVVDMGLMFYNAYSFNQPIDFNCSSCTTLSNFLNNANSFNSPITLTPIPLLTTVANMLDYTVILPDNYSNLLIEWGTQDSVQPNVEFISPPGIYYNETAEQSIETLRGSPNNWTITNGGLAPAPTIYTISPTTGPSGIPTSVVITGTNFEYSLRVMVNEIYPPFQSSSEQIVINMPTDISPSEATITIQTNYGITTTEFTYTENYAPTITEITPSIGTNGTIVQLVGTNFDHVEDVMIVVDEDYDSIDFNIISDTQISITIPELSAGLYVIRVVNNYNIDATTTFEYENGNEFITNEEELNNFLNSEEQYGIIDDTIELTENILNSSDYCKYLILNDATYKLYKSTV